MHVRKETAKASISFVMSVCPQVSHWLSLTGISKTSVAELVRKFPEFFWTCLFITMFSATAIFVCWARSIHFTNSHLISLGSIEFLFSHLPLVLPRCLFLLGLNTHTHTHTYIYIYRVSHEECARLREGVPYVKVYRHNPKHLCPKLNGYGDNGQRSLKLWQLLHTCWLPNTY